MSFFGPSVIKYFNQIFSFNRSCLCFFKLLLVKFMTATSLAAFACCPCWCLWHFWNHVKITSTWQWVLHCWGVKEGFFFWPIQYRPKGLWDGQAEQTAQSDVWLDETFSSNVPVMWVSWPLWSFRWWHFLEVPEGSNRQIDRCHCFYEWLASRYCK